MATAAPLLHNAGTNGAPAHPPRSVGRGENAVLSRRQELRTLAIAERVDARRADWRHRAAESKARGRAPQNAGGKYLLSGGMLICSTCGGHFEVFKAPWKPEGIYVCATRRRKPGVCTNTLRLPVVETDERVLVNVRHEALSRRFIEDLLSLVDKGGEAQASQQLAGDRSRLQQEVDNLVESLAAGVPASTVAAAIKDREAQIAAIDVRLRSRTQPRRGVT